MGVVSSIFNKNSKRILMTGLDSSGKTTILYRLKLGKVIKTTATVAVNIETIEHNGVSFIITDAPNTRKIKSLQRIYLENTDGVIFVIDSHDRHLIKEQQDEVRELIEIFYKCPLLIFANKQDLPDAMASDEIIQILKLNELPNSRWHIQGASGAKGDGLRQGLDWLEEQLCNK